MRCQIPTSYALFVFIILGVNQDFSIPLDVTAAIDVTELPHYVTNTLLRGRAELTLPYIVVLRTFTSREQDGRPQW